MAHQHESLFSYNLSRPYPFRWFTWVTVIGGIAALFLFTVINLGANGYVLKTIYTTDPNGTLAEEFWFEKAPWSWMGRLESICEPQNLAIGTTSFTTNMGLSYELISLTHGGLNDRLNYVPAAPYLNNTLQNCTMDTIDIKAERTSNAQNSEVPWIWGNSWAAAVASCTFFHVAPPIRASFRVTYSNPMVPVTQFPTLNNQSDSGQWWGSLAMDNGMKAMNSMMGLSMPSGFPNVTWNSADFGLIRNYSATSDITSPYFLSINGAFHQNMQPTQSAQSLALAFWDDWDHHPVADVTNMATLAAKIDGFGKAFYASIMHDLGPQNGTSSPLINETIIEYLLHRPNRTDFLAKIRTDGTCCDTDNGVNINEYYAFAKDKVAPLSQKEAAQLYQQYVCSIPERKRGGSLVVSVIISNLVLLSASWTVLNWAAARCVAVGDRRNIMNWCPGCLGLVGESGMGVGFGKVEGGDDGVGQRLIQR